METKYFDNGFVGKKVDNANEAIMLHNAGMDIRAQNGCDFLWCDEDNEEPSVSEVASRIIECIKDHGFVYAGFELAGQKVVRDKATMLSCDIQIGQTVYFILDGCINHGSVSSIYMATDNTRNVDINDCLKYIRSYAKSLNAESAMSFLDNLDYIIRANKPNGVIIKLNRNAEVFRSLDEIFATKESLIEHLLANAK